MPTLDELAAKPAGQDQIERANAYCEGDPELLRKVSEFVSKGGTRGQMVTFLEELRPANESLRRKRKALAICRSLGIETPTNTELLLADRNAILETELDELRKQMSAGFKATNQKIDKAPGVMTGAVVGALVGAAF